MYYSVPAPTGGDTREFTDPGTGCAAPVCRAAARISGHRPRPRDNDSVLCRSCVDQVGRDLASLPGLYDDCGYELIPSQVSQIRERITGGRHYTIPYNSAVASARSEIMGVLASWAELVVSERQIDAIPRRTASALTSFLLRHLDWLTAHAAACDFAEEVSNAAQSARNSIQARPSGFEVGPCVRPGCDNKIYVAAREVGNRVLHQLRCSAGHTWEAHEWLLLAHELEASQSAARKGPST